MPNQGLVSIYIPLLLDKYLTAPKLWNSWKPIYIPLLLDKYLNQEGHIGSDVGIYIPLLLDKYQCPYSQNTDEPKNLHSTSIR